MKEALYIENGFWQSAGTLALRNALDDSAIDLPREIGALAGPLSPLVAGAARHIRARALEGRDATWN